MTRTRKVGLVISLLLSLLFTVVIVAAANKKYGEATQPVEALRVKEVIPAGVEISSKNTEVVKVPKPASEGLASPQEALGKVAKVPLVKGQLVYKEDLDTAPQLAPGHVEVLVPVDLSSSAYALPGSRVDVFLLDKDGNVAGVVSNVRVTRCLDSQGKDLGSSGGGPVDVGGQTPQAVGIEVPVDRAQAVVAAAAAKRVYLVKTPPSK